MARPMLDPEGEGLTQRLVTPMTKAMEDDIKEFWHSRRLDSKAAAVRHLIQVGLDVESKRSKR